MEKSLKHWVVGITGASGTAYARRLVQVLLEHDEETVLHVVFSEAGLRVMREEEGISTSVNRADIAELFGVEASSRIKIYNNRDIGSDIASGSFRTAGMVVVPCSMSSLAAIANGLGESLIHRAADVTLKEGRELIVVPRETPLSPIQLQNMLTLSQAGARMVPAMPGFYHQPQSVIEIIDMMVMKILDVMGYRIDVTRRWEGRDSWPLEPAAVSRLSGTNEK